jgi:hypothetical protein
MAPGPATPVPSTNDTITNHNANGNFGGCGLLLEAWNAGGGVSSTTTVSDNTVTGSVPAGIVLHANTPHAVISGTVIGGNALALNNWTGSDATPVPTATALIANPLPALIAATVSGTQVTGNLVSQEVVDVWRQGPTGTTISSEKLTGVPVPEYTQPVVGGGIFTFGNAAYDGSLPGSGIKAPAPVIGVAQTRDLGEYWVADANGEVYGSGNATFDGPVASKAMHLTAPIVGMQSTPVGGGVTPNPNTLGYWLVGSDGKVYAFGDAGFFGSTGNLKLVKPVTGIAGT